MILTGTKSAEKAPLDSVQHLTEYIDVLTKDAVKLYRTIDALEKVKDKTLLAPNDMKSPVAANAFMKGSSAAFSQMSEMASFVKGKLDLDFKKLSETTQV